MTGVTVQFDGVTAQSGADGVFRIEGTESTDLRPLSLSGGGIVQRATFARTGDSEWLAIPGTFDMAAFQDVARDYEPLSTWRGLLGHACFFIGRGLFLADATQPAGVWLFIVGSLGMLVESLSGALRRSLDA